MSTTALRVVPVVDGITESADGSLTKCTAICASKNDIYVGRSNGKLERYAISSHTKPVIIPTVERDSESDTGTKRPVNSVACVGSTVVALSNEVAFVFDRALSSKPVQLCKGVSAFAISDDGSVKHPSIAVVTTRRKLFVYDYSIREEKYVADASEVSMGSEIVLDMVWFNGWVIGYSSKSYFSVCPGGDRTFREIFPVDQWGSIEVLRNSNEIVVTGHDGLGIFLNVHASPNEIPSPAPRNTIAVEDSHEAASMIVIGTYLVVLQGSEGHVGVYTMGNDLKQVQNFSLPNSALSPCYFDSGIGIPVVAGPVMYLLVPVPFETQFKKLIDAKKFPEALELINYQFSNPVEKQIAIQDFHRHLGWSEFHDLHFQLAFLHFNLGGTESALKETESLLEFFNSDQINKIIRAQHPVEEEFREILNTAYSSFVQFLQTQRQLIAPGSGYNVDKLELTILDLMNRLGLAEEIETFLATEKLTASAEAVKQLLHDSPAMAAVLEKDGDVDAAIDLMLSRKSLNVRHLLKCMQRNAKKIKTEKLIAGIKKIIPLADEEMSDTVGDILSAVPVEITLQLLEHPNSKLEKLLLQKMALLHPQALLQYAQFLVESNAVVELENFILSGTVRALDCVDSLRKLLPPDQPGFLMSRMLLFSLTGDHRNAMLLAPHLGTEYIGQVVKESEPSSEAGLLLILLTILFETNQYEKAVDVFAENVTKFQLQPSKVIAIIPADLPINAKLLSVLNRLNSTLRVNQRKAVISENLNSYSFLKTYSEWATSRQYPGVLVNPTDSICTVCNQPFQEKPTHVLILPNGTTAHSSCFSDAVPVRPTLDT